MPRHRPCNGGAVRVSQTRRDGVRYDCGRANGHPTNNNQEQQQGAACGSATAKWQNNQRATRRMEMLHMKKDEAWRRPARSTCVTAWGREPTSTSSLENKRRIWLTGECSTVTCQRKNSVSQISSEECRRMCRGLDHMLFEEDFLMDYECIQSGKYSFV